MIQDLQHDSDRTFWAYATSKPLDSIATFRSEIDVGKARQEAKFYVIQGGTQCLVGNESAIELGIMKIGININKDTADSQFPKFKAVLVKLPINSKVLPVIQQYRRISIPLEELINKKLDELLRLDKIKPVDGPSSWVSPTVPVLKSATEIRI